MLRYRRDIQESEMGESGGIDENPPSGAEQSARNTNKPLT